jgi:hypothetical protein
LKKLRELIHRKNNKFSYSLFLALFSILPFFSSIPSLQAAQVTVAWDPVPESQGYRIYFGTNSGYYEDVVDAGSRTACTITGLAAGVTYYFVCTAYGTGEESNFSNEIVYTTSAQTDPVAADPASGNLNSSSGGGGCFIATAAYGSEIAPEVEVLRGFRDRYLLNNRSGQVFVNCYYRISPPIAAFISEHEALKTAVRWSLVPVVCAVKHPVATLVMILLVPAAVIIGKRRRRSV